MIEADQLFNEIAADLEMNLHALGQTIADKIKSDLSVPVEYVAGPRGGVHVIRSKPGEHPRKETGKLQAAVDSFVVQVGVDVELNVFDPVDYAGYLDPGMERPIVTGIDEEFEALFLDTVVKAIEGG